MCTGLATAARHLAVDSQAWKGPGGPTQCPGIPVAAVERVQDGCFTGVGRCQGGAKHDVKIFGATAKRKKFVEGQLLGWRLAMRAGFWTFEAVSRKFKCVARCVPSVVWNGRKTVREGIFEKGLKTGVFFFLGPRSVCGCYVCGVWKFSIPH